MNPTPKNEAHRVILSFGGVNALASFFNITKFAVYAWIEKDCIPPSRLFVLAQAQPELFATAASTAIPTSSVNGAMSLSALCALQARVSQLEMRLQQQDCCPNKTTRQPTRQVGGNP